MAALLAGVVVLLAGCSARQAGSTSGGEGAGTGMSIGIDLSGQRHFEEPAGEVWGRGASLRTGLGITPRFELHSRLSGARIVHGEIEGSYLQGQLDLGARRRLRSFEGITPYLEATLSTNLEGRDRNAGHSPDLIGVGLGPGAGLVLPFLRSWDASLGTDIRYGRVVAGKLANGQWARPPTPLSSLTARLHVGVGWHGRSSSR